MNKLLTINNTILLKEFPKNIKNFESVIPLS